MRERHIRFAWAIKRLLRQKANFVILEGFLSELLGEDVSIAEILDSESSQDRPDDKFNRVDMLAKDGQGKLMLVEVQVEKEHDYFHRMCFGQAKLITQYIKLGAPYSEVKKVHSINIVYFDLGQGEDYLYEGLTEFRGMRKGDRLKLSPVQQELYGLEMPSDIFPTYHLIKANSFDDVARNSLDEWIYFLKNGVIEDSFKAKGLPEARELLQADSLTGSARIEYEIFIKTERIRQSEIDSAFVDGQELGKEEMRLLIEAAQQAEEEAKRQAEEAIKQAEEAKKQAEMARKQAEEVLANMARMLYAQGLPPERIAASMGQELAQVHRWLEGS